MAKLKTGRHTGALKAARQAERRMYRNRTLKKKARQGSKDLLTALSSEKSGDVKSLLNTASSSWDKAAKKGAIHWKTAARRKSRLAVRTAKAAAK